MTAADTLSVDGLLPGDRPGLTELLAATSLATDLVTGQPLEHALRACLLSVESAVGSAWIPARCAMCIPWRCCASSGAPPTRPRWRGSPVATTSP